jgi:hypothetical protein
MTIRTGFFTYIPWVQGLKFKKKLFKEEHPGYIPQSSSFIPPPLTPTPTDS